MPRHFWSKTTLNWAKKAFFAKNDGAPRFWLSTVTEPNYPLDPTQNYNNTWGILKIPPSGRTLGPFPRDSETKLAKMGETVTKKEGKNIFSHQICYLY